MRIPDFSQEVWQLFADLKEFFGGDDPRMFWNDFHTEFDNDCCNPTFIRIFYRICFLLNKIPPRTNKRQFIKQTMDYLVCFIF